MWNSLFCIVNDFLVVIVTGYFGVFVNGVLEASLQRILVHLVENGRLKELALKKDQEILRLVANLQRDMGDIDTKASKISDLERNIAALKGQIRGIENRGLKETGGELSEKVERLMHELDESRRKEEEMAELKQRLATRLEEQDSEMKNKMADWGASYDILLHAKEEQVEAQRALEEQLENNETELDRLRAALSEREQALSIAIRDSERKDREVDHLRSSFNASHNELDARDGSLATLRLELDRLTSSLEASRNQNRSLEEKIKVKTTEVESTHVELLKLAASLATAEKKAADDLKDAQRENERQTSQVTALRENLGRLRSEEKARDDAIQELKKQLKEAGDERRMKENKLQASASRQTELESRLTKQIEDAKALERELANTKGQLIQLTILSEERGLELVSTQKQSNGMRDDITKVQQHAAKVNNELLQLKLQLRDSNEKCSELEGKVRKGETEARVLKERIGMLQKENQETQDIVLTRGHDLEETKKALEAATAEHSKLQKLLDDANDDIYQKAEAVNSLSSSLQHSQSVVDELKKQKEALGLQSAERQATVEAQKDEIKEMLYSTAAERNQLRNLLDDARNDISQKFETISSLTSSLQHSQNVVKDMETQRETLVDQSSEMQEMVKKQVKEIKKIEGDLAELKKSYETVTEQLRLEMKQTKDKDSKLSEAMVRLHKANSTLGEREQALSVTLEDFERKDKEIDHLRSSLNASHSELNVRDSSLGTLQQEFNSLSSSLERLRRQNSSLEETVKVKTTEAESSYAELQNITGLLARAEKKAADDLQDAQKEIKAQSLQTTALRRNLERVRSEEREKDNAVKELENLLREARDVQKRKEEELQTSASRQTELGTRLNKQSEDAKALERQLTDTKGRLTQLTALSEQKELELVNTRKESDGMRDSITKLRQELSSLKSDRGSIEQSLRKAEKNTAKLTDDVVQLKSQLQDSHEKCFELEETMKQDAVEAELLKQGNEELQMQYDEMQEMVFTRGHDLEETKKALESTTAQCYELESLLDDARNDVLEKTETVGSLSSSLRDMQSVVEELKKREDVLEQQSEEMQATMDRQEEESERTLDSATAERDKLQNLLDDARSDIAQKLETILALTASLQQSQSAVKDMETQRETLVDQSSEMQERVKEQMEEIKKIEGDLAKVTESYETVTEQLRLEMERTQDKDDKLAETVARLQIANSTLEEREQALSVALGDFERKNKEIDYLRSSLIASHNELNVRDSSLATLGQESDSLSSSLEGLRHQNSSLEERIKVKTTEADSLYAELQKITGLLAMVEKKAADDLQDAQREIKAQSLQTTALRQNLEREERAKDSAVKELENLLREARDVQRRKEEELRTSASRQAELETRLNKQSEDAKKLERELANTKDQASQVTILLESREVELLSTRKESDSMRDGITILRQELGSLKSNHGSIEQSLRTAEKNATRLTDEVQRLKSQLRDSREKCSELETTVRQDEIEARSLKQRIETLQRQYEQMIKELKQQKETLTRQSGLMQMTLERQKNELTGTLDSTTVERDQLRNLLDDARRDIEQKTEAIRSLTSELQHPQRAMEENEARKGMLANQLMEMHQTAKRQMEEIKTLKQSLVDVKKSRETVMEELRLERERTKDADNKVAKVVQLQTATPTLREHLEQMKEVAQARRAEALAFQQSKQDGILKLREAVAKKMTESQAADASSKAGELQYQAQERRRSATTGFDLKRPLYEGRAEVDSRRAIIAATQNTQSPAVSSQALVEEPDEMDAPSSTSAKHRPTPARSNTGEPDEMDASSSTSTKRRPTPVRSNTGALTTLLEGIGVRGFWTSTSETRRTLPG